MKKILSLCLIAVMVLSLMPLGSIASEVEYVDFVKGSIDDNLVVNFTDTFWYGNTLNDSRIYPLPINWINGVGYAGCSILAKEDINGVEAHYGSAGLVIGTTTNEEYPKIDKAADSYQAGERYVFVFSARNINPEVEAKIRVGVHNGYSGVPEKDFLPIEEYEDGTIELPQSGEWVEIKTVLPAAPNRVIPSIRVGLISGTKAGAEVEFNARHPEVGQVYYAKETAHDITVDVLDGSTDLKIGAPLTVEAAVFNQLENKGNLIQDFSWVLLDSDNKVVEEDFEIVVDESNSSRATLTNTQLENGYYSLVATSTEYGISRFLPVEVTSRFEGDDYVSVPESDNLIQSPTGSGMIGTGTSKLTTLSSNGYVYPQSYNIRLTSDISSPSHQCYEHGFIINKDTPAGGYVKGDKYLFSIWVRNAGTEETPFIVGLSNAYNVPTTYGEIYGSQGIILPPDGKWYNYVEVLTMPGDRPILSLGFPAGSKAGASVDFNFNKSGLSPAYFAKERVADIVATASESYVSEGGTVYLNASVVNQFANTGSLNQNFTWTVLDAYKNYKTKGYTLTPEGDKASLHITSLEQETIFVAVTSTDYGITRMIPLSLNGERTLDDYTKGDMPQNLIKDPGSSDNFLDFSSNYTKEETGDYRLSLSTTFTAKNSVSDYGDAHVGASGFSIQNGGDTGIDVSASFNGGTPFVFGAHVKNVNGTGDVVLDAGLSNSKNDNAAKPVETQSGYTIPAGDDWYKVAATIKLPGSSDEKYTPYLSFGFGKGTDAGDKFELNRSYPTAEVMYFAPETAYDITVDALGGTTTQIGNSLSFKSRVLNQVGTTGYLSQDVTWYVWDDNKTDVSRYFIMNQTEGRLTLTPGTRAKGGRYTLIAASDDYTELVRHLDFFVESEDTILYVSTEGDDSAEGTELNPLASLQGAIDKISERRSLGIWTNRVIFLPGEYVFEQTAEFTASESYEFPITFCAQTEGSVVFTTAEKLNNDEFELVTDDTITSRFAPGMNGRIYSLDLEKAGYTKEEITDITKINGQYTLTSQGEFNTLYFNGLEQNIAMWPDNGYATKGDGVENNGDESNSADGLSFVYYDQNLENTHPSINCDRWENASDFWIASFEPYDYSKFRYYVTDVDPATHTITILDNPAQVLKNKRTGRWKAFNLIEEITLPGEYAIDTQNMMLYYYPQGNIETAHISFSSFTGSMVDVTSSKNIVFDSIVFARTRDKALTMMDVENITVSNCEFRDIASVALFITGSEYAEAGRSTWQSQRKNGGHNVAIRNNDFWNIGQTAIQFYGAGDVDTLTSTNNVIEGNFINNTSNKAFWEAVVLGGCGIVVRNNSISATPMQAIRAWGSNHLIEYNEIYDVVTEDADCAAIYWGGSSIYQGTVVRYNYIHHTDSEVPGGQVGIYWDDCQLGQTAKYNILAYQDIDFNSNGAAATVHHYNTTYKAEKTLNHHDHGSRSDDTITRDLCYESLEAIRADIPDLELFYSRYPYLESVIGQGINPTRYTSIIGNLAVGAKGVYLRNNAPKYAVLENNTQIDATDAFADIEGQDFRLVAGSDLAKANPHLLNTDNFDIDKIGVIREVGLGDFSAVYPQNGSGVVDYGDGVSLSWTSSKGANSYRVVVARDPQFSDIVYQGETPYTSIKLPTLEKDVYYWQVEAQSISREFGDIKPAAEGTKRFRISEISRPIYVDSDAKPENAIADPSEPKNYNQFNTASINPHSTNGTYKLTVYKAFETTGAYDGYLSGFIFRTSGGKYIDPEFKVPAGEKLILKIPVKNAGSTDSVRVNASLINSGNYGTALFSEEYGSEGVVVTDKENWTELVFTFEMTGTAGEEYKPRLTFGFPKDTAVGSAIAINLTNSDAPQAFVSKFVPQYVEISSEAEGVVNPGQSVKFSAQLFKTGDIQDTRDTLNWYVTNENRSEKMDSESMFVFSGKSSNKSLRLGQNIIPGKYYAIAESKEDPNIRKGIAFEVGASDISLTEPQITADEVVEFSLTYNGSPSQSFVVYVAGYTLDSKLAFIVPQKITDATTGQRFDIEAKIPEGKLAECTCFKVFTWKDGLVPIPGGYIKINN